MLEDTAGSLIHISPGSMLLTAAVKAIVPQAAEYMRGLEERAERLEIAPNPQSVEEYRTIMDDAWPGYVRGATWRGR